MRISIFLTVAILFVAPTRADVITFDLTGTGGDFDFNAPSGTFTDMSGGVADGLQISIQAFVVASTGDVNATGTSLGVNESAGGDDTDQLDGDNGLESLLFSFNDIASITDIRLTGISIVGFAAPDSGTLTIGANSNAIAATNSTVIPAHTSLEGGSFTVAYTSNTGNGFGLESISLDITAAATPVPEPNGFLFGGVAAIASLAFRRRKTGSSVR